MTPLNERSGPGTPTGTALYAANSLTPIVRSSGRACTHTARRIEWAARLIRAAGKPIPRYGSPEWHALPEGSPAKVAAVVVSAESWAREGDELEERLRVETQLNAAAFKAGEDADYCARRDAHKASWTGTGFRATPGEREAIESEWNEWLGGESA